MPGLERPDELGAALSSEESWQLPSPHVRAEVLAAIAAEVAAAKTAGIDVSGDEASGVRVAGPETVAAPVVPITPEVARWAVGPEQSHDVDASPGWRQRWTGGRLQARAVLTIAAALVVAAGLLGIGFVAGTAEDRRTFEDEFVLKGTDPASAASARVGLLSEPSGWEIRLLVDGLVPASKGSYYAAWLQGPDGLVPIGSFHLRGGTEEIVLWGGVDLDNYDTVVITVQSEAGPPIPSERVVMVGSR